MFTVTGSTSPAYFHYRKLPVAGVYSKQINLFIILKFLSELLMLLDSNGFVCEQ